MSMAQKSLQLGFKKHSKEALLGQFFIVKKKNLFLRVSTSRGSECCYNHVKIIPSPKVRGQTEVAVIGEGRTGCALRQCGIYCWFP